MPQNPGPEWVVFDYEVNMLQALMTVKADPRYYKRLQWCIQNALTESLVLHTRILADILLSQGNTSDDIHLKDLIPGSSIPDVTNLANLYGNSKASKSPYWTFNKMLAHSTKQRSGSYDYSKALNQLIPEILMLVEQINKHHP